jgi:hypothetical protein
LPDYLPWTDAELGNIERALKRYKTLGMEASADISRSEQGVVTLSQVDTKVPDAPIIIFEIHKLKRTDTALRSHFVVQLQSVGGSDQGMTKHGCVSASSPVFVLAKAEKDVQEGFAAKDSFDMAANAYWLKL